MDFRQTLERLVDEFESSKVRYALIGGVAMGLLGHVRATIDADFLIHRDDLEIASRLMAKLGYKTVFSSENVTQYEHSQVPAARVDFIHAFRDASVAMLRRAKKLPIDKGHHARVAAPEDVIGLKVQSMANDPSRKSADLVDIEALMSRLGKKLDWKILQEYFILFGMKDLYGRLKGRFGA